MDIQGIENQVLTRKIVQIICNHHEYSYTVGGIHHNKVVATIEPIMTTTGMPYMYVLIDKDGIVISGISCNDIEVIYE